MGKMTPPAAGPIYIETSALIYRVEQILTNDAVFRRVPGLKAAVLDEEAAK